MLILLSLLAVDPSTMMKVADGHRAAPIEASAPRRSPYRLDPNVAGPADGKGDAVQATGTPCSVVGGRMCTRKPRTIYAANY